MTPTSPIAFGHRTSTSTRCVTVFGIHFDDLSATNRVNRTVGCDDDLITFDNIETSARFGFDGPIGVIGSDSNEVPIPTVGVDPTFY